MQTFPLPHLKQQKESNVSQKVDGIGRGSLGGKTEGRLTICLVPSQVLNAAEILGTSGALETLTGRFRWRCLGLRLRPVGGFFWLFFGAVGV
jgi:hypothetical protein